MDRRIRTRLALLAALAIAGSTAAAPVVLAQGSDFGDGPPVTLTLGVFNGSPTPQSEGYEDFAARVAAMSNGNITIELVTQMALDDPSRDTFGQLRDGTLDMVVVGSKYWHDTGATSLDAFQAPLLIDSVALLNAVVSDPAIAGPMVDGISESGFTGLAAWPESLRHPVSFGAPFLSAGDYAGKVILEHPHSVIPEAIFAALGATTSGALRTARDDAIMSGAADSLDNGYGWMPNYPKMGTTTGNVTLYAAANILAANEASWGRLTSAQQDLLREAATATTKHLVETNEPEATVTQAYCEQGGRVVLTDDTGIASFAEATRSVTADLEQDARNKDLIGRIQALKDELPPPPAVTACGAAPEASPSAAASGDQASTDPVELLWTAHAPASITPPPQFGNVALDPAGNVWVADVAYGRFMIFSPDGTFLETWGSPGTDDGQFNLEDVYGNPYGYVAFAPDGSFYVLDAGNYRVQRFDANRNFVGSWGSHGYGSGQFAGPQTILVDTDGSVYVMDGPRAVIEHYTPNGTLLGSTPVPGVGNDVAFDGQGGFIVSYCCGVPNHAARVDATGATLMTIGGPGSGPGRFQEQTSASYVDAAGRIFIAEIDPVSRIQMFDRDGQYLGVWGAVGENAVFGQVKFDGLGNVYMVHVFHNQLQKFKLLPPFALP